jgi:hypothetical protein
VKKILQQRHFRRLCLELIVRQAGRKPRRPFNQKSASTKREETKKEEKFSRTKSEENYREEDGRKRNFKPPLFHHFRPAADTRSLPRFAAK